MSDRLSGISVLVSVVEAGSFALAANRLHLSRSAVGKTIARLEQRLGVRLFHRTTRSLNLTDDGALFYERCLRALEEIRVAENLLESGKRQVKWSVAGLDASADWPPVYRAGAYRIGA